MRTKNHVKLKRASARHPSHATSYLTVNTSQHNNPTAQIKLSFTFKQQEASLESHAIFPCILNQKIKIVASQIQFNPTKHKHSSSSNK